MTKMKTQIYTWGNRRYEVCAIPKNKKKVGLLGILGLTALVTPGTNPIYLGGLKLLTKYNPLWVYR